jgi:hypothetical protein
LVLKGKEKTDSTYMQAHSIQLINAKAYRILYPGVAPVKSNQD